MSGAMLKQMMEEASAFLKEEKYEKALDASRRVSQFNASNFPALMCVGVASFHLQLWEDAETALRRAADLKPELPAPWKNLVDLYDATGDSVKKIEVLEKLIGVFRSGNKIKPSQKWVFELATTTMSLKLYGRAFDAWFTLVDGTQGLSVDVEANDELPSSLVIWLTLTDLLQLPAFSLADAKTSNVTMESLVNQFTAVAQRWNWLDTSKETESLRIQTDAALAMFFRHQLNQVKTIKAIEAKQTELKKLDTLTCSLVEWFPTSKLATEYLLLRSEDDDAPIDDTKAHAIASQLGETFSRSPMVLMFQGFAVAESEPLKARDLLIEGLASCSASSFHEGSLCVRAQMTLASIALRNCDVEGCLARLHKAHEVVADKTSLLGTAPPKATVYSEIKLQLLRAQAHDIAGAFDAALEAYTGVVTSARECGDGDALSEASVGASELLCSRDRPAEALALLDTTVGESSEIGDPSRLASLHCSMAWAKYLMGDIEAAKTLLQDHHPKLVNAAGRARALKRLAIVDWHLGGTYRTDKSACFNSLLQAAKLAPRDGEIFAWLGKWYNEVSSDIVRAEKCFLKALSLTPLSEMAGVALSEIYARQGKTELNIQLWQDLTAAPESAPTWALLRLAQHLVDHDNEDAVSKLHIVLRNEPLNATFWVAMGHVYRHFGKLVAAQRSYLRAMELGENGWCVLTELARIEGSLHLYDDAIARIQHASSDGLEAASDVISTLHAELLFDQAKYFNGEGLYGRAAVNIKKAATLLQPLTTTGSAVPVLKLLGDIHSFAFYLSPLDFAEENDGGWIDFLSRGRAAYEKVVTALASDGSPQALSEAHYDMGVTCWYQARALYSIRGKRFNAFALQGEVDPLQDSMQFLDDARTHLRKALTYDPSFALAWNALGVVLQHPLAKQFAWTRAIQASNLDVAWANLGMLYVHHRSPGDPRTAALARNALLHLQAVNTNNPAMWIGYGMLYLNQKNRSDYHKAREAFQCALEMGNHLDALQGVVLATITGISQHEPQDELPSLEVVLFAIKKYLERESADPLAWSLLSTVQFQLGHLDHAVEASSKSRALLGSDKVVAVEQTTAIVNAVKQIDEKADCNEAFENIANAFSWTSAGRRVVEAQRLYRTSDILGALKSAQTALDATTSSDQQGAVVAFVLALCALLVNSKHAKEAHVLAEMALGVVTERMASGAVTTHEVEGAEAYYRAVGSLDLFLSLLSEHNDRDAQDVCKWIDVHRRLALVDAFDSTAFSSPIRGGTVVDDALYLSVFKSLLAADPSLAKGEASSPLKLVRAEPWNPSAYVYAALCVYKNAIVNDSSTSLTSAVLLLETGLRLAEDQPPQSCASSVVLLHWTCALVHHRLAADKSKVKTYTDAALESLPLTELPTIEKVLWEARIHALMDHTSAIAKYSAVLQTARKNPNFVLAVLYELGGVCESAGLLDAAHHVWKTVMSWKATTEVDTEAFNVTGFLGNLHLAIVHATKQNTKAAKKFSKTAVTLATAGEANHDAAASAMATTARFVESVIAKM